MKLAGWGRFPVHDTTVTTPRSEVELSSQLKQGQTIARGNGRAYGDSAVSHQHTVHMKHFNHMIAFNKTTGQLTAEAGVLLADIITTFLPHGWFPSVTPGTKFVTLGGMIAADVHGKNHHRDGSLGNFVDWIDVMSTDGTVQHCSRKENKELFEWTLGGMGLTGIIVRAAIRLVPVETGWVKQKTIAAPNLDTTISALEDANDTTYSVAWLDCLGMGSKLGRSLIMLGEHATLDDLGPAQKNKPYETGKKYKFSMPLDAPFFLVNSLTVRCFNQFYYWKGSRSAGTKLVDWDSFFYPLDAVLGWNKIYGRRGFAQFQCVLPLEQSQDGLRALLDSISRSGMASFLTVLKRFGEQKSRFSFPMLGYTLAVDFPVSRRSLSLMATLDKIVIEHGGRFYLAKDSRMTADTLAQSDQRSAGFAYMRRETGLKDYLQSVQSERLAL